MNKLIAMIFGMKMAALAVIGLFVEGHLFKFINVDMNVDILRVVLAVMLIYAGMAMTPSRITNSVLILFGLSHVGIGIAALFDPEVGGFAPSGYTGFDVVFYLAAGLLALTVAMKPISVPQVSHS